MAEVFLMEDSYALRRILVRHLREAGHNVTAFEDGDSSRDRDLVMQADVLVTDLDMPRIDGATAIRNVRRLRPSLPILVITGVDAREAEIPPLVNAVLTKPFSEEDLVRVVQELLDRKGERPPELKDALHQAGFTSSETHGPSDGAPDHRKTLSTRLRSALGVGRGQTSGE